MQDMRGLGHLHHESRSPRGQIIARANPRKNPINGADVCLACRNKGADVRHQYHQSRLAHIGGLAAHIRAGNDQHAPFIIEAQIIGHEGLVQNPLHHWMSCLQKLDAWLINKLWPGVIERLGAFSKIHQHINLGQGHGRLPQSGQFRLQALQQIFIKLLLPRQSPLPCRQHFVLKAFELRRDVSLSTF